MTHRNENDLKTLALASEAFASVCTSVREDQWGLPTPCTDWLLNQLVDHVTGGNRFTIRILRGEKGKDASAAVIESFTRSHDIRAAAVASIEQQRQAFSETGALDRRCEHLGARMSGSEVLRIRIHEVILHTWDIGESIAPPAVIPDELIDWALTELVEPGSRTIEHFGLEPSAAPESGQNPQQRLLSAFGRLRP